MSTINEKQDEVIEEFEGFTDWMDKYQMLIDLGNDLEPLDAKYKTEQNLIDGCQSRVWLQADYKEGLLYFTADSDSLITKGIMGLAAGLAMADREEPKYGRCTIAAALGCVAYYILYFFKSFAYDGLLMGGLTAATAAAALPLKIPASIFNGAVAIILAPPLCIALRHALKRAHLRLP